MPGMNMVLNYGLLAHSNEMTGWDLSYLVHHQLFYFPLKNRKANLPKFGMLYLYGIHGTAQVRKEVC